ncbi:fatty acid hydroxylase [Sulfitobacter alexandrii]|uniref:Fatty acid hydroxylase n=1 Tax=Sulfitobacter alexandrii TaxID=1917485 RepID=A0A1J0WG36_9RHOB|nr:sterol desaturase family protein [Sulfitobacter alexandrii]APE43144.1 fatty acid hydroxylase [Sulfitobacter alexandrii]
MQRLRIMAGHPALVMMALAWICGVVALLLAGPAWAWYLVPLGIGAQLLNEYNLHRFVFHLPPPRRQWAFDLLYRAHYGHHDFPTNTGLFFVPAWVALPMLAANFLLVWGIAALVGVTQPMWVAVAIVPVGGVAMFMVYEWFHMTAHLNIPKSRVAAEVTRLHNQHHFRDFSRWFHVSPGGRVIDRAMGTDIDREALKQRQRVDFIRTLGLRPDDSRLVAARARFAPRFGISAAEVAQAGNVKSP